MKLRPFRAGASPLEALAWGFLGLTPVPLVALLYAGESELARRSEIGLASVFFVFAVAFFVAARFEDSRDEDAR